MSRNHTLGCIGSTPPTTCVKISYNLPPSPPPALKEQVWKSLNYLAQACIGSTPSVCVTAFFCVCVSVLELHPPFVLQDTCSDRSSAVVPIPFGIRCLSSHLQHHDGGSTTINFPKDTVFKIPQMFYIFLDPLMDFKLFALWGTSWRF